MIYIYKKRLEKYEALNIPPTEEERDNELPNNAFKEAYEEEQTNTSDNIEVEILLKK
jgi:hypothetical protein